MTRPTPTTTERHRSNAPNRAASPEFTPTSDRPIAAVQRALAVLDCLAEDPADLGTNEIARRVGSNASSVSRLLGTLASQEYVSRIPNTGRYRLGLRLVELGHAALARVDLREVARPHLLALTAASGETATLSVPGEATPMTVDFVQSPASVRSVAQLGRPAVPHATATGKVFLAYRPMRHDRYGEAAGAAPGQYLDQPLMAYTLRTITDPQELAAELAAVRSNGYAQALGERESEMNAIAVPVLAAGGEMVAMLGLQGPAGRFDLGAMRGMLDLLLEHSQQLAVHAPPM